MNKSIWNLHNMDWGTTMPQYAILSSKKHLIWCLKTPWELALKPEGKYSIISSLSAPIILQCKRGGNKSLYVHTDLLQLLNVQAIVINQKFKIKQKAPFLQLWLKIKASGLAF